MNKFNLYDKINTQILNKLKENVIPWKKSWECGLPANFISKNIYHGINFLSLSTKDFSSPYYLTFYQCKSKGGSIKSGEKSSLVIYYKLIKTEDTDSNKVIPFIRYSNVFNLTQTTLELTKPTIRKIISCESILENMIHKPIIKNNISKCYYSNSKDYISLPQIIDFNTPEEYYSTLFHEIIHWTGHKTRLNRKSLTVYKDENYNYEELVAEIGSAYLSAICGISPKVVDNQTAYIEGWLRYSKDKELVFPKAAKDAQKAVGYIIGN